MTLCRGECTYDHCSLLVYTVQCVVNRTLIEYQTAIQLDAYMVMFSGGLVLASHATELGCIQNSGKLDTTHILSMLNVLISLHDNSVLHIALAID